MQSEELLEKNSMQILDNVKLFMILGLETTQLTQRPTGGQLSLTVPTGVLAAMPNTGSRNRAEWSMS